MSRPLSSDPAPMSNSPPPMIGPGAALCSNRPIAADTTNAAADSGNPVRPDSIGESESTDCSQIVE